MDLWTAVIGVAGTLLGGVIAAWMTYLFSERHARRRHLTDRLFELYTDAYVHAYKVGVWITELTWTEIERRGVKWGGLDRDLITAKMEMIAPPELRKAWSELVEAELTFRWTINLTMDQARHYGGLPKDDEDVVAVRQAVDHFIETVHRTVRKDLPLAPRSDKQQVEG